MSFSHRTRYVHHRSPVPPAGSASPSAVVAVLVAAFACATVARAAALDDGERDLADTLATAVPWTATRRADARATPGAAGAALGVQTLVVEDESRKGAAPGERRARVYQHDHGTGGSRRVLVDLVAGEALETRMLASPHLPLNAAERRWALARLADDAVLLERLRDDQRRRGALPFATLDELEIKASVFEPTDPAHPCARERCALLSLFDVTRTVFAVEPLLRFADGRIGTLTDGFGER